MNIFRKIVLDNTVLTTARYLANLLLNIYYVNLHVVGYKKSKHDQRMIFVSKATHPLEKLMLFAGLPGSCSLVIREDIFKIPFLGRILNQVGMIRERNIQDVYSTMDAALEVLEKKNILYFLNEISFSLFERKENRDSLSWINEKSGVVIVPVALTTDPEMLVSGKLFNRPGNSYLMIGEPIQCWSDCVQSSEELHSYLCEQWEKLKLSKNN